MYYYIQVFIIIPDTLKSAQAEVGPQKICDILFIFLVSSNPPTDAILMFFQYMHLLPVVAIQCIIFLKAEDKKLP